MRRVFYLLVVIVIFTFRSYAQAFSYSLESFIEELTENSEEGISDMALIEDLQVLYEAPIDLNRATLEQLCEIPFLDPMVAGNILQYRLEAGKFLTVYELSSVEGVSPALASKLSLFVFVSEGGHSTTAISNKQIRQQLLIKGWQTFPLSAGYLPTDNKPAAYLGDPRKYYARYEISNNKTFKAGLTADKDPGEPFFSGSNRFGFDFYSGHLTLHLKPDISYVIVGDYSLKAGQGLILQPGFSLGKTANILNSGNPGMRLRPYTSTDENFFFRGIATQINFQRFDAVFFASHKKSDANRIFHDDGSISISGLQTSGYHRTRSEMEDKNKVGHSVIGTVLSMLNGRTRWGTTFLYERFQFPIINNSQLFNRFQFQGNENANFGVDYRHVRGKYQLFGEGAISLNGSISFIQGFLAHLHDQMSLSMLYRSYGFRYHATWGNGFGETNQVNNESGYYAGFRLLPVSGVSLSGYVDWFASKWMSFSTVGPSRGRDMLIQADIQLAGKMDGYVRYKRRIKGKKINPGNALHDEDNKRSGLRLHLNYRPASNWVLRTRVENSFIQMDKTEKGFMVLQDVGWTSSDPEFSIVFRAACFKTDSYESRIYAYENDLLYNFSTISFFGKGYRTYLNLKYRFSSHLDMWLKIAYTAYFEQDNIGSGYNMIEGDSKSEMKIQFRYRL